MTRRARWIAALAAVALLLAVTGVAGALSARSVANHASAGKSWAEAGARSLASQDATAAATRFASASSEFAAAQRSLGPSWVGAIARSIPWVGAQYRTTETLLEVGVGCSKAGADVAEALRPNASRPSQAATPAAGLAERIAGARAHIEAAVAAVSDAETRVASLSADGLVPQLASAVTSAKGLLGRAAPYLRRARALVQLESYLFSGEHRLVVASQDGAELRPTGGFVGSYGVVDVGATGARLEAYRNVYLLPDPPGIVAPPPGAVMTHDFGFRDANWWIDFPTSAREMLKFWSAAKQPPADGIVAIDTVAMRDLLVATGPITVPGFSETFTSGNLLQRLLYLVEVKNKYVVLAKKDVLVALAAELESRLLNASPAMLGKAAMALGRSADEKHVQLYVSDPSAEAAITSLGWSGRAELPQGATDVLAVSNAMNEPGKVNIAVEKTISYQVTLRPDRSAETTLVLRYANTGPYPLPLPSRFLDWLRVYRAPGTAFPAAAPGRKPTVKMTEFGLPAEVRSFTLLRHQSHAETFNARVPNALRAEGGAASSATYQLHIVRQDDLVDVPLVVTVAPPSGWHVTGAAASLTASQSRLPVETKPEGVGLSAPLMGDIDLTVQLAKQ